jgi:hypothetical protein
MSRRVRQLWAVIDKTGHLYVFSIAATRSMAIAHHVYCTTTTTAGQEQPSQYAWRKLDELQRERWKVAQKRGERAVKVTVSWSAGI